MINLRIAYFITPHGYGHAARACAIMNALAEISRGVIFDIYTLVPEWFFTDSLNCQFQYHSETTDIGLIQKDPLHENIPATLAALESYIGLFNVNSKRLANQLNQQGDLCVLCDIAILGIASGKIASIPSVLIGNFSWDWIYRPFCEEISEFCFYSSFFEEWKNQASYIVGTRPVCDPNTSTHLNVMPVARRPKGRPDSIRKALNIPLSQKIVLITMGGIASSHRAMDYLQGRPDILFMIPGEGKEVRHENNIISLPNRSSYYHPDLLFSSDAVIGKAGYSTVAEAYQAGIPYGCVARENFRESPILMDFIKTNLFGLEITDAEFQQGSWLEKLDSLLLHPKRLEAVENGAEQVADWINNSIIRNHPLA